MARRPLLRKAESAGSGLTCCAQVQNRFVRTTSGSGIALLLYRVTTLQSHSRKGQSSLKINFQEVHAGIVGVLHGRKKLVDGNSGDCQDARLLFHTAYHERLDAATRIQGCRTLLIRGEDCSGIE